jgi:hypothetical protein
MFEDFTEGRKTFSRPLSAWAEGSVLTEVLTVSVYQEVCTCEHDARRSPDYAALFVFQRDIRPDYRMEGGRDVFARHFDRSNDGYRSVYSPP